MKFKSLGWVSIGYQVMVHTATTRPSSPPHSYVLSWISVSMSMTRSKNELVACTGIELAILKIEIWNKYRTSIFSYSNLNKKTIIIKDIWSSLKSWWFVLGALFSLNGEWWLRFVVEVRSLNGKYFSRQLVDICRKLAWWMSGGLWPSLLLVEFGKIHFCILNLILIWRTIWYFYLNIIYLIFMTYQTHF